MSKQRRTNIVIRRQPFKGSTEAQVLTTAKTFYGSKFNDKVGLALVDVLEPLHIAITTGSERKVKAAISRSLAEIQDWHKLALNQCRDYRYISAQQAGLTNHLPDDRAVDLHELESLNGTGMVEEVSNDKKRD
ncbi:MAG: hypothetical protein HC851_24730 [Acaryochloris sp. RU_4_1]|nr:hypothetical protein [Acaryochloris sp. RU_4_1]NJR57313.1 hypothetical protein [Acaryochloris sp. CRU_2_0]